MSVSPPPSLPSASWPMPLVRKTPRPARSCMRAWTIWISSRRSCSQLRASVCKRPSFLLFRVDRTRGHTVKQLLTTAVGSGSKAVAGKLRIETWKARLASGWTVSSCRSGRAPAGTRLRSFTPRRFRRAEPLVPWQRRIPRRTSRRRSPQLAAALGGDNPQGNPGVRLPSHPVGRTGLELPRPRGLWVRVVLLTKKCNRSVGSTFGCCLDWIEGPFSGCRTGWCGTGGGGGCL